jgi:hypothetical protein
MVGCRVFSGDLVVMIDGCWVCVQSRLWRPLRFSALRALRASNPIENFLIILHALSESENT